MSVVKRIVFTYNSGYFYKNLLLDGLLLNILKMQKTLAKSDKKVYNYLADYFFERICLLMIILVVNAGSSSLKYQLIDMKDESLFAKGNCD